MEFDEIIVVWTECHSFKILEKMLLSKEGDIVIEGVDVTIEKDMLQQKQLQEMLQCKRQFLES